MSTAYAPSKFTVTCNNCGAVSVDVGMPYHVATRLVNGYRHGPDGDYCCATCLDSGIETLVKGEPLARVEIVATGNRPILGLLSQFLGERAEVDPDRTSANPVTQPEPA